VSDQVPDADTVVNEGSEVQLVISLGAAEYWNWTGNAGTTDFATAGNWELLGTPDPDGNPPPYEAWQTSPADERVVIANGDTVTSSSDITVWQMFAGGESTLRITGGTLTSSSSFFGIPQALLAPASGPNTADIMVSGNGTWTSNDIFLGRGSSVQNGATLTVRDNATVNARDIVLAEDSDDLPEPTTGTLILIGNGYTVNAEADLEMRSENATLRFVAANDATPFGTFVIDTDAGGGDFLELSGGIIEVDLSAYVLNGGGAGTWTLVESPAPADDSGGVLAASNAALPIGLNLSEDANNNLVVTWDGTQGDTDADGLTDFVEQGSGTDFTVADTDGDGLTDGEEVNTYGTNPLLADTDNDGVSDGEEVANGTDPLNAVNTPAANLAVLALTLLAVAALAGSRLALARR
jgi:hypothetical protein